MNDSQLKAAALLYHSLPRPGKIEVVPTKPLTTQEDLSLGYTPGVAEVCRAIAADPEQVYHLTSKGNLVAVITNGTAVLGLGNIGPLAGKPVMEGKAVLFKKFAHIDVFDLELNETDPDKIVDIITALAPTFGGINLEDFKAPECFEIERKLRERLDIPVLHDDQHGTAIILLAAFMNAMSLVGKDKNKVKIVCCGAGAAGVACMQLLLEYGVPIKNITMVDVDGVVYKNRPQMNAILTPFAHETKNRTLADAMHGADAFFGLSVGGALKPEMVATMAAKPIIFAMANPTPEIMPDEAKTAKPDAIIGTGRSDFPNQINNVLGFPYLFRGALDCGAKTFNTAMKLAAAHALANLARKEADAALSVAYKGKRLKFGTDYFIPKPFDARLLSTIAPAVAKAAMDSGVATRPIEDLDAYATRLRGTADQSFTLMRQIMTEARKAPKRIVYPEGEDPRILQAAQNVINEGVARPIILGRESVVKGLIHDLGLPMKVEEDFDFIDPWHDPKLSTYASSYYELRKREGVLPPEADLQMKNRWPAFAAMMVRQNDADAMVCGVSGRFNRFLRLTAPIVGKKPGVHGVYALQLLMNRGQVYFIADTHVNVDPTAEEITEMTYLACEEVKHFGIHPRVALLSHSNFGSSDAPSAQKMKHARELLAAHYPDIVVEGEMQADSALNMDVMRAVFPNSALPEPANILIMPGVDAANIAFNLMRCMSPDGLDYIGPILLGMNKPVHILAPQSSVRRIVNMSALAVLQAQLQGGKHARKP